MQPSSPKTRSWLLSLALAASTLAGPAGAQQALRPPEGVATFRTDTVALGVGYSWGRGRLTYGGRGHNFTITGLSLVGVGAERLEGVAEVRNLKSLEDFAGVYVVAGASGSFVVLSGATAVLRNAKGVEIRVKAQGQGMSIAIAAGGAVVKLG